MRVAVLRVATGLVAVLIPLVVAAPAAVAWPVGTDPSAEISTAAASPGAPVTVTVAHTTPGALEMSIDPDGRTIGSTLVDANGNGSVTGLVPADATGGFHVIGVTGAGGEKFLWDLEVQLPPTSPDIAYSSTCAGPDQVVVAATFSRATPGATYRVDLTSPAGVTATASRTATSTSFVLTLAISAPPGALTVAATDGTARAQSSIVVDCAPAKSGSAPDGTTSADNPDAEPTLAATGPPVGAGAGLGLVLVLAGAAMTASARRRPGTRRR